jgi:hypothetical protein
MARNHNVLAPVAIFSIGLVSIFGGRAVWRDTVERECHTTPYTFEVPKNGGTETGSFLGSMGLKGGQLTIENNSLTGDADELTHDADLVLEEDFNGSGSTFPDMNDHILERARFVDTETREYTLRLRGYEPDKFNDPITVSEATLSVLATDQAGTMEVTVAREC